MIDLDGYVAIDEFRVNLKAISPLLFAVTRSEPGPRLSARAKPIWRQSSVEDGGLTIYGKLHSNR